ncbi:hypothetical protein E4U54_002837 [Claviceps lovelessii]|nr:hypothetical protein E4U54_002837 [Claviceps lovelessii]
MLTYPDETSHLFPHVTVCPDGSYCCDRDGPQCCVHKKGVFLDATGNIAKQAASTLMSWGPERTLPGFQTATTTTAPAASSASASASASATNGPASEPEPEPEPEPQSQSGTSASVKLGAGIGIPLGVLGLGACAASLMVLRRRRQRQLRRRRAAATELHAEAAQGMLLRNKDRAGLVPREMPTETPHELQAKSVHRAELPP